MLSSVRHAYYLPTNCHDRNQRERYFMTPLHSHSATQHRYSSAKTTFPQYPIDVIFFLDTPNVVQIVCVLFGNGHRDQPVCIMFANVFYIGPLMSFLIQPIAVTNNPCYKPSEDICIQTYPNRT